MTKTLSRDIRKRFCRHIEEGCSARAAGRALRISPATAVRFRRAILDGRGLAPKPRGGRRDGGKLAPYRDFLIELVEHDPDITLFKLRDALAEAYGVRAHHELMGRQFIPLAHIISLGSRNSAFFSELQKTCMVFTS